MRNVLKRRHYTEEIAWHCLKEKFRKKGLEGYAKCAKIVAHYLSTTLTKVPLFIRGDFPIRFTL